MTPTERANNLKAIYQADGFQGLALAAIALLDRNSEAVIDARDLAGTLERLLVSGGLSTAGLLASSGLADVLVFKGAVNASTNPNYPAANAGDVYRITVAGKIGGGSGPNVEVGDMLICTLDGSAAGTQAAVGANWLIEQANIDGAVIGPASATDGHLVQFDGTTGKLIKGGIAVVTDLTAPSDSKVPTSQAVATAIALGYLVYDALLTQSGSGAPTAAVKKNQLSGAIVWTRVGPGAYEGTLAGAFAASKVAFEFGPPPTQGSFGLANAGRAYFTAARSSNDVIRIQSVKSNTTNDFESDDMLADTFFRVRVYP